MAATIGTISVDIFRGYPQVLKPRVDVWEVPGLDGYGAQLLGNGEGEWDLTTISYQASSDAAQTFIVACEATQGTVLSVTDDWGNIIDGVLVVHVDTNNPKAKMPCIYQGNALAVRVEVHWKMITTIAQSGGSP